MLRIRILDPVLFLFRWEISKKEMVLGGPFLSSQRCCSCFQMLRIYGSGMFITDPGSNFCPSRILEPGSKDSGSWIRPWTKNISIITPKKFLSSCKYDLPCSFWIRIFFPIPDPGSRGKRGTGSCIRIRNTRCYTNCFCISVRIQIRKIMTLVLTCRKRVR